MNIETVGPEELGYPVISDVEFSLTGAKIIGIDGNENPVYKYSEDYITNELGQITISNLEWDSYTFFPDSLDLISPEQPVSLAPDINQDIRLILQAENSLLVTVQDIDTGEPIFSAEVGLDSNTQYTDENGQTYFIPLEAFDYAIEIQAAGYTSYSGIVSVFGDTIKIINLQRIE